MAVGHRGLTVGPRDAHAPAVDDAASSGRPVLLTTLGVPFDERASVFAVDTVVEQGERLIVANVVHLEPLPCAQIMGHGNLEAPELTEALRRPAELAGSLGVEVERVRVKSFRPVEALLELVAERAPGLLVFGPDRGAISARRYRKAVRALCHEASCLVWLPE